MKVLVLGGAGMLGHKVVQRLSGGPRDVWWTLRPGTDEASLKPVPLLRESETKRSHNKKSNLVDIASGFGIFLEVLPPADRLSDKPGDRFA